MPKYKVRTYENVKDENQECCVYEGDILIHGPCTKIEAEGVNAVLNALAESKVKAANAQLFAAERENHRGKIIAIEGGIAIQNIGCHKTKWHDILKLSNIPEIGVYVEISYKDGYGIVKVKVNENTIER